MTDRTRWALIVIGCGFLVGAALQVPQILHMMDDRFQGIPVSLNSDEAVYLARVQEALSGRPDLADEAFIGDPQLKGSQVAFLEAVIGSVYSFTGWRAATVLQINDTVMPWLLFVVLWMFLRLCGFTRKQALAGTVAFSFIEFYNLGRPLHLRVSTLLTLVALSGLLLGLRGRTFVGILGGFLLGTLVGVYVWSWTFAWAWWGVLLLWLWGEWQYVRSRQTWRMRLRQALHGIAKPLRRLLRREEPFLPVAWQRLLFFGVVGVLAAWPHILHLVELSRHPLYEQAVFRSGMHPGRLPESWAYSILFITMLGSVLLGLRTHYHAIASYRAAVVTIVAAFIIVHQQVVHGIVFNFVSHSIFFLVIAALCMVLLWWNLRDRILLVGAVAACVYLAAVAYDGRFALKQFRVQPSDFARQHLASSLPVLDDLPRTRMLSDIETQSFIAGFTKHDIVYSVYLKNVLLSHRELAERFCLSLLPLPPPERRLEERGTLIYPDAVSAFDDDPSVRAQEVLLVHEACARIDRSPTLFLRTYGVQYVLWNEKRRPEWDLDRLAVQLEETARGDGWSLWRVVEELN